MTAVEHGYNRYTRGCRCQICRDAKAAYTRAFRAAAAQRRCPTCRDARAAHDRRRIRPSSKKTRAPRPPWRTTRYGRSDCRVCGRGVALLAGGFLRAHRDERGRDCDGSWTRSTEAINAQP